MKKDAHLQTGLFFQFLPYGTRLKPVPSEFEHTLILSDGFVQDLVLLFW